MNIYVYLYIYIYIYRERERYRYTFREIWISKNTTNKPNKNRRAAPGGTTRAGPTARLGRGDDTVGNPRRARISRFFEFVLLPKLDKQLPVEQFEETVFSVNSTLPPS